MRKSALLSGALLVLALASPLAMAQVYKWTDANGRVHYGDTPPPNATQIRGPTPPAAAPAAPAPAAAPAAPNAPANAAPAAPAQVSPEQAQQVQRDVAAARAEQCKTARENYDKAVRARRITTVNEKGERVFLNDKDADNARLQLKADVDTFCGS